MKNKKNMTLKAPRYSKQHLVGGQTSANVFGEFTGLFHMNYQSFLNTRLHFHTCVCLKHNYKETNYAWILPLFTVPSQLLAPRVLHSFLRSFYFKAWQILRSFLRSFYLKASQILRSFLSSSYSIPFIFAFANYSCVPCGFLRDQSARGVAQVSPVLKPTSPVLKPTKKQSPERERLGRDLGKSSLHANES